MIDGASALKWGGLVLAVGLIAPMLVPPPWLGMGNITPAALRAGLKGDSLAVVDVRTGMEFSRGHIPGALSVPLHTLPFALKRLGTLRDREVVLICLSGHRSRLAGWALRMAGFARVSNLTGGMMAWRDTEQTPPLEDS